MNENGKLTLKIIGAFLGAMVWFFFSTLIAGAIITALPRPMQGEAPVLPKAVCLGVVFAVQFAIPAILTLGIIRKPPLRIGCFVAIACAMLLNHRVLEGIDLLDKAWRRGL